MSTGNDVAVVGMSVLLPGSPDLDTYWHNLTHGVDAITELPDGYGMPEFRGSRGGFLGELATVDAAALGVMPAALDSTEPDQLIALRVATAAVTDAGGERTIGDPGRAGVILGRGGYLTPGLARIDQRTAVADQLVHTLGELLPDVSPADLARVRSAYLDRLGPESLGDRIGLVANLAASRVANRLGLGGPAYTVDAACASSLIAVDHAVTELTSGRCDFVLAGGVHHGHHATLWNVFNGLGALSRTARSRPLDRDADGLLIGEGTAVVALKRLADARADGNRVYAVIRGTGVASDGGGVSLMHPASVGQIRAVRRAWAAAGLDPAEPGALGLLEAHATATPTGDAAELETLREVFGSPNGEHTVIGSVKSMIGHTMPASGMAGLVKAALAVHHGVLPPTLHCDNPHPALAGTRFRTIGTARPWQGRSPRRAAVNAFGFGGISAHVILEQDAHATPVVVREPIRVLRLSAESPERLAELLDQPDPVPTGHGIKLAVVEPTERKLAAARKAVRSGVAWRGRDDVWFSPRPLLADPGHRLVFVHPGLEAEFEPRLDDIAAYFSLPLPDLSSHSLGRHGRAVVAVSRFVHAALDRLGVTPDAVAGHSVGEWTAMISAGMFDDDQLDHVLDTYTVDSFEVPDLVFAALGCAAERVLPRLAGTGITLSHDNSPNQCIVCGPEQPVRTLLSELLDERIMGQLLPFRSGFHTPELEPYLKQIRLGSEKMPLRPATRPIWSATTASPYPAAPDDVRTLFYRHLLETVRFRTLIENLHGAGARVFVQAGPGRLNTLISDTLKDRDHLAIAANTTRHSGLGQLARVTAALWVEGREVSDELITPLRRHSRGRLDKLRLGSPLVSLGPDAAGLLGDQRDPVHSGHSEVDDLLHVTREAALSVLAAARRSPTEATKTTTREMSLRVMPHLRDHSFYAVPEDWPDDFDRFPVVPATELVRLMMELAAEPDTVPVAVHDARFEKWLAVEPAVKATFECVREQLDKVRVTARGYAGATVELGRRYPARTPPVWAGALAGERRPRLTARELYERRWMFHGPAYQGVTEITAISDDHVRGVINTPAAPGALLDNAGHLVGYWILETFDRNSRVFPVRFERIRFYTGHPPAGERLSCVVRIRAVTESTVTADVQLVRPGGRLWAFAEGWTVQRFASDERLRGVERSGGTSVLAERPTGDWAVVREAWPGLASREIMARRYLSRPEWTEYERQHPRDRRGWLLGRMAVKDAVRLYLWDIGWGQLYPIELEVTDTGPGRVTATRRHGPPLPDLTIAVARHDGIGAAAVRPPGTPVGIEVLPSGTAPGTPLSHEGKSYVIVCSPEEGTA
ncbi:beta-ketoacyl synthase N-terminal-like domain-containing protein [Amycolatopsis speibonae]|uniref:Beta-ketoacyl synthase N-terminal-like domain-containing protein n=1 Tax=Amycolatopsis speibonae TaxID=1450224 RepID=A0ABV7P427_9PSEU